MKTKLTWRVIFGLRAMTATLLVAGLLAAGARTVSAQDDESGLDDNTFTGPNFGWSVEWDEDAWEFDEEDNEGSDYMSLSTVEDPFAIAQFFGVEEFAGDPDDCVAEWEDFISGRDGVDDVVEDDEFDLPETPRGGAATAYTYVSTTDDGDLDLIEYVSCQTLVEDEAVLILTILTTPNVFEDIVPLVDDLAAEIVLPDDAGTDDAEDVTPDVDDEETPEADDEDVTPDADDEDVTPDADDEDEDADAEPTRDVLLGDDDEDIEDDGDDESVSGSGIDGAVYTSPTYGFTVEWDDRDWTVDPDRELIADGREELDRLFMSHEDEDEFYSSFYIEGKVDYDGDPLDCVEGEADLLSNEDAVVDFVPLEDRRGDPVEGESDAGGEFGAFIATIETEEGDEVELVEHIECQTLEDGESVVIFTLITSEDLYEDELALAEDVIATLELDGGSSSDNEEDDEPADDEDPDEDEEEDEAA